MKSSRRALLVFGAIVALFAATIGIALFLTGADEERGTPAVATGPTPGPPIEREAEEGGPAPVPVPPAPGTVAASDPAYPPANPNDPLVEVVLEHQEDPYAPSHNRGAPPRGAGKTASLAGRVTDAEGRPVASATLGFVGGLNLGESAIADEHGLYEFPRLYPGANLLEVESGGMWRFVREVRLNPGYGAGGSPAPSATQTADFRFHPPTDIAGRVVDAEGKPIAGAEVRADGRTVTTDPEGYFWLGGIVPGDALLYLRAPGHAPRRETVVLQPGYPPDRDRLNFALGEAATLSGECYGVPPGAGPAYASIVPSAPPPDRVFPFEDFGRIEIPANGLFEIEPVPTRQTFEIVVSHPQGRANPPRRMVWLRDRGERNLVPIRFRFLPARPVGGVVWDGEADRAFAGAEVALEVADLAREVAGAIPGVGPNFMGFVVTPPSDLRAETRTDEKGAFALGVGSAESSEWRWLDARAPGYRPLERAIRAGSGPPLRLVLFAEGYDAGTLRIEFGPTPSLQVALTLNGSPKPVRGLPAGEPLVVPSLAPGLYAVRVRFGGRTVFSESSVPVGRERILEVPIAPK